MSAWTDFARPYLKGTKSGGLKAASKAWAKSSANPKNTGSGGGGGGGGGSTTSGSKKTRAAIFKKVHRGLYGLTVFQLMTSTTARQQLSDLIDELQAGGGGGGVTLPSGPNIPPPPQGGATTPVSGESVLAMFDRIQDTGYGEDIYVMDLIEDFDFTTFFDMLWENIFSAPGDFFQIIRNAASEPGIEGKLKGGIAVIEKYPGPAMTALYVIDTGLGHDVAETADDLMIVGTTIEKIESKVPKKFDPGKYARMVK